MDLDTSFGGSDAPVQEPAESVAEPTVQNDVIEDLADPFLKNIPAQDRAVVARYVKDWNSGAQKKFREYVGRVKPYEELGSVEDLQKLRAFAQNFQTNPEAFFRVMYQGLQEHYGENFDQEFARIIGQEVQQQMSDEMDFDDGQPDEDTVWRSNIESELEEFREWKQQQEQSRIEQQEFEALDTFIGQMHTKYGDFDDTFVLTRLADGRTAEQAFQDWQGLGQRYFNGGAQRQAPKVMGGQGGVPSQQIDATKLRGKDRRGAVEALLSGLEP